MFIQSFIYRKFQNNDIPVKIEEDMFNTVPNGMNNAHRPELVLFEFAQHIERYIIKNINYLRFNSEIA